MAGKGTLSRSTYGNIRRLAWVAAAGSIVFCVIALFAVLDGLINCSGALCAEARYFSPEDDIVSLVLLVVALIAGTAAFVCGMIWTGMAFGALRRAGRTDSALNPIFVGFSWVIPVVNLVVPYLALLHLRRGLALPTAWRAGIFFLWMLDIVFYVLFVSDAIFRAPWAASENAELVDTLATGLALGLLALLIIAMTRKLSDLIDDQTGREI